MNHSFRNMLIRIILLLAMLCLITNCNQNSNEPLTTKNATLVSEVNGPAGMVHVDDGGADGIPVIFLHSFAGDTTHWTAQLRSGCRAT